MDEKSLDSAGEMNHVGQHRQSRVRIYSAESGISGLRMQHRATSVPSEKSYGAVMPAHPVLVSPLSTVRQPEPFVNADTAAAFVGITRRTLLQKVRAGRIPGHALDCGAKKREWRFKLSELDHYLCSAINSVLQPPEPANRRI